MAIPHHVIIEPSARRESVSTSTEVRARVRRTSDVTEPVKRLGSAAGAAIEEREERERGGDGDAVDGHAGLRDLAEERRGLALLGEHVKRAGRRVHVLVARRERGGEDDSVDDVREDADAGGGHEDDERRLGGRAARAGDGREQVWVLLGHAHADDEEREDVEEHDPVEDGADGRAHRHARVLRLECDRRERLHTTVRERGLREDGPEAEEAGRGSGEVEEVVVERLLLPVAEATSVVVRASSKVDDETKDDEAEEGDELEGREPEFKLSEVLGTGDVDEDDADEHNSDVYGKCR
jgi:hypothetical protein